MKLTIVGQGVKQMGHITLEGLEALQSAKKVLHVSINPTETNNWLQQKGITNSQSIKDLYELRARDEDNYRNIMFRIRNELKTHQDVAVLLPGHPRIGVTLLQWLEEKKQEWNLELKVLPGISSFATMINDLRLDPLEKGSQVLDANRLLLFEHSLNSCFDSYIYHVCSVGTSAVNMDKPSKDNHIGRLKQHLLKFYTPDLEVTLICSNIDDSDKPSCQYKVKLGKLESLLDKIHFGTTLFLPGVRAKSYSTEYLELLKRHTPKQVEANRV